MTSAPQSPLDAEREIDLARWRGALRRLWWLVAAGLGAAVLPRLAVDERRLETAVLELAPGVVANRTVAVVWSRMQPPRADAAAFVESARSACAGEGVREPLLAG